MKNKKNIHAVDLKSFYLFKNVSTELISEILPECSVQIMPAGQYLVKKDFQNSSLYLLIEGQVEIYLDEEDKPLKIVSADEVIGEISLIDHSAATASVITLCECKIVIISEELVWEFIEQSHIFAINFLHLISNRFRSVNSQVVSSIQKQRLSEQNAAIDDLTKLLNRGWLNKNFETILECCKKDDKHFSYFMIDIDFFKKINDTYGHPVGDMVLQKTAELLKKLSRASDYVVRYGGEEIAMLLPNTEATDALKIAERIRLEIEQHVIEYEPGKTLNISVSIGVASLIRSEISTDLIKLADSALYHAKSHGRNQVRFHGSDVTLP